MQTVARRALEWPSQKTEGLRQNIIREKERVFYIDKRINPPGKHNN